jgi:hypothetical protein
MSEFSAFICRSIQIYFAITDALPCREGDIFFMRHRKKTFIISLSIF